MSILYYESNYLRTIAYGIDYEYEVKSLIKIVEDLCLNHLFTYDGYRKAVYSQFGLKKDVPLVINEKVIFIFFHVEQKTFLINYRAILSYGMINNKLCLLFINGKHLLLDASIDSFKTRVKRVKLILEYKLKSK